mgnify:CR=1 FL=1
MDTRSVIENVYSRRSAVMRNVVPIVFFVLFFVVIMLVMVVMMVVVVVVVVVVVMVFLVLVSITMDPQIFAAYKVGGRDRLLVCPPVSYYCRRS